MTQLVFVQKRFRIKNLLQVNSFGPHFFKAIFTITSGEDHEIVFAGVKMLSNCEKKVMEQQAGAELGQFN